MPMWLSDIPDWPIGIALLAAWVCVGIIVLIVQRDHRRRRARRARERRDPESVEDLERRFRDRG